MLLNPSSLNLSTTKKGQESEIAVIALEMLLFLDMTVLTSAADVSGVKPSFCVAEDKQKAAAQCNILNS